MSNISKKTSIIYYTVKKHCIYVACYVIGERVYIYIKFFIVEIISAWHWICTIIIFIEYGDQLNENILWDPLTQKNNINRDMDEEMYLEQLEWLVQDHTRIFICRLNNSLYGLKQLPRQWYKMFDSFIVSRNFTRSEYDHCVFLKSLNNGIFIILVLYASDMLVESICMVEINRLKS